MKLYDRIERYLSFMMERGTQTGYRKAIRAWCNFLGAPYGTPKADTLILRATPREAEAFIAYYRTRQGFKPRAAHQSDRVTDATITSYLIGIRSVYGHLARHGLVKFDPFDRAEYRLRPYKNQKRPTLMIPYDKVPAVLKAARKNPRTGIRDAAALALYFGGALRRNEPREILMSDVCESRDGSLIVRLRNTKDGIDTEQIITRELAGYVIEYVRQRYIDGARPDSYLFTAHGREAQISTHTLYYPWRKAIEAAGLDPKLYSPHSARATVITKALDDGHTHREVMQFSRHKSVKMVERYDKRLGAGKIGAAISFSVDGIKVLREK